MGNLEKMKGSDTFCVEVDNVCDDDSIGDETPQEYTGECACTEVQSCSHFEEKNGKVLAFFDEEEYEGSGCGGAWDSDFRQVIVCLDHDGDVVAHYYEWNICSCGMNIEEIERSWWKRGEGETSLYASYEGNGKVSFAERIWKGDYNACISSSEHQWLDESIAKYLRACEAMDELWYSESLIFRLLPKDLLRLILLQWIDEEDFGLDAFSEALRESTMKDRPSHVHSSISDCTKRQKQ